MGRLDAARHAADQALRLALHLGAEEEIAWCHVEACRVSMERGAHADAAALAIAGRRGSAGTSTSRLVLELVGGRAALLAGDRREAAGALRRVSQARLIPFAAALADQLRAELLFADGQIAEGLVRFQATLDAFAALPALAERALALFEAAQLVSAQLFDSRVPVDDWLREAQHAFATLGNAPRGAQAARLEADWLRRRMARAGWEVDRSLLEKVGQLLESMTSFADLTRQAMHLAVEQVDADRGVLLVFDRNKDTYEPVAQFGASDITAEQEVVQFSRNLVSRVVEQGRGVLIYDATTEPDVASPSVTALGLRALVCVPMFLHGRITGAVYLDSRRPGAFGEADRRLLDGFAQLMAAAIELSQRTESLSVENARLRHETVSRIRAGLLGSSRAVQKIAPDIQRAALSHVVVLLTGETGTGKDLVAKIVHESGPRQGGPFVSVNCGAFPPTLLEAELFGILNGVASGVVGNAGCIQSADGGTLFLDEIAEMPLNQQVALLSVIRSGRVTPIGARHPINVNVRIIAATHRDLPALIEQGRFREDLFYRLDVLRIHLPPLRDRKSDIPELARHFAAQWSVANHRPAPELAPDFLAALMREDWPGNVRQLENFIERSIIQCDGDVLHASHGVDLSESRPPLTKRPLIDQLYALERRLIVEALRRAGGIQSRAARALGLSEPTFRNKLLKHGLAARRKLRTR